MKDFLFHHRPTKGRKKLPPSLVVTTPKKYPDGHAIKPKKLKSMVDFIQQEKRQFYFDLSSRGPPDISHDSDNPDCE